MTTHDPRFEEEEEAQAAQDSGLATRVQQAVTASKLRAIDGAIDFCERWRNRIRPVAAEDMRGGRTGAARHGREMPAPEPVVAARPSRWRGRLIVLALLVASAAGGMMFSYRLLARIIASDDMIIDDLRDQVAQMEKAEARSVNLLAKNQQQIAESNKAMREYQATIQGNEEQLAELRQQVSVLTPSPPPQPLKGDATVRRAAAAGRRAPDKTGDCAMSTTHAAADLARCFEKFNRQ
ncbi:MAG: hypothetical protein PHY45_14985 [Rhodocyclaceae bacterium]|nr:hypothetical protein [Rhodocyclaceae bacterium]